MSNTPDNYRELPPEELETPADNVDAGQGAARDILVNLADKAVLWHDLDRNSFATIFGSDHSENWPIKSPTFRDWMTGEYYKVTQKAPSSQALTDALATIKAKAKFSGMRHETALRVGQHDGVIYHDLGEPNWRAVEITDGGWRVVDDPPVKFIRSNGMRALPNPVKGGQISELQPFLNFDDERDFQLIVAFLVACLRPTGPYPILVLNGEQGAAKSTTARVLRQLIDPHTPEIRSSPREERDLVAAARNNWLLPFDNLSGVPGWLSDGLCRLATGGGLGGRQLYTDFDEAVFDAKRPMLINGIPDLATRGDLADRAIVLTLPVITEADRKDEAGFWAEFEVARPKLLGNLLEAVCCALRRHKDIQFTKLPRMADFAIWATAAEPALGWTNGTFIAAYEGNRQRAAEIAAEADPVAVAIIELVKAQKEFENTVGELLTALGPHVSDDIRRSRSWPKDAARLGSRLRMVAPSLRHAGIEIDFDRNNNARTVNIRKRPKNAVTAVTTVTNPVNQPLSSDSVGDSNGTADPDAVTTNALKTNSNDGSDGSDSKSPAISPPVPSDLERARLATQEDDDIEREAIMNEPIAVDW